MADVFREVDEDLRQERAIGVLKRIAPFAIAIAVTVIAVVGGYQYYASEKTKTARQGADQLTAAVDLAADNPAAGMAALESLAQGSGAGYRVVARFRIAGLHVAQGDLDAAITEYRLIANDATVDDVIRDYARLRAAYAVVDSGSAEDVTAELGGLDNKDTPLALYANEVKALAAIKAQDYVTARSALQTILLDLNTSPQLRARVSELSGYVESQIALQGGAGATVEIPAPADEAAPADDDASANDPSQDDQEAALESQETAPSAESDGN